MFALLQKATPTAYGPCPETLLPEITKHKKIWPPSAVEALDTTEYAEEASRATLFQRHLMPLSNAIQVNLICKPLKISSMTGQSSVQCSEYQLYFRSKTVGLHGPGKETKIYILRSPCKFILPVLRPAQVGFAWKQRVCTQYPSEYSVPGAVPLPKSCRLYCSQSALCLTASRPEQCQFASRVLFGKPG